MITPPNIMDICLFWGHKLFFTKEVQEFDLKNL